MKIFSKIIVCATLALTGVCAQAETYSTHLLVHTGSSDTPLSVQVVDGMEVKMADNNLTVASPAQSYSYDLADVKRLEYAPALDLGVQVGITTTEQHATVRIAKESLTVVTPVPGVLRITDLSGKTLMAKPITDTLEIHRGVLPKGVYILTLDGTPLGRVAFGE